ncbi:MAG: translation elongation factor 4 [Candidatus Melainabacteria bacterium]|nr:translation elongation factor 4 [Candidatus Melainabacteria bacterium]
MLSLSAAPGVPSVTQQAPTHIRNFCIIAHIDHGKSTLADRLLERTGSVDQRQMKDQLLDSLELERERGITIKLNAARMSYPYQGQDYILNLIDTPGHVDFSYEVSRSLEACEGALLVVDASQGVEAQTLANVYLAIEAGLEIIPVINKIDLPGADPDRVKRDIEEVVGIDASDAILASAKEGVGIDEILAAIVEKVPPPTVDKDKPLRALVFDSYFDPFLGIIVYCRVVDGQVRKGDKIRFMANNRTFDVTEVGTMCPPARRPCEVLTSGEVGYMAASIKEIGSFVGDTITRTDHPAAEPLAGYKKAVPMVFCGLYPVDNDDYAELKESLEKLKLNDASITFEPETSEALGFGFRCGFLGLLHMEIIQERLEREYHLNLIRTAPSVVYKVHTTDGTVIDVDNPARMPDPQKRTAIEEPYVKLNLFLPQEFVGTMMDLAQDRRGIFLNMDYLEGSRVNLQYELPLSEMVTDFYDQLKSRTKGYASMDYQFSGYRESKLVKLDIMLAGDTVDALSVIVHTDKAYYVGRTLTEKLKEIIPRQMFEVPIQAAVGGRVLARSTVKAMRKNVLEKCYGGDISRKRKLLEKQKAGKKRMKAVGRVEVPQEAFMAVLKLDD